MSCAFLSETFQLNGAQQDIRFFAVLKTPYLAPPSSLPPAVENALCWLDMMPEEQAAMERTYILGTVNHVPQAPDTITAHMRVDLLDAVPKFLREKMTRSRTHQVQSILFYIMKTLLPSTEYSRIGIARDITRPPCNGVPRDLC
eukprot:6492013-Amphidinium_carterae.1